MLTVLRRDCWRDEVKFAYCCVSVLEVFGPGSQADLASERHLEQIGCWETVRHNSDLALFGSVNCWLVVTMALKMALASYSWRAGLLDLGKLKEIDHQYVSREDVVDTWCP